ncbi:ATP-binding protein [Ruminococcaceae bacterium OttesenSCG-928-I18]|nr:ATP-binding protein [Ruminococcaceae bacterium OttesenSCG-928-I18]
MLRHAMNDLIEWKNRPGRKPLLLRGARQVGKTWLMKELGRLHFKNVAYINFDNNERMAALFQGDLDIERLIISLQIEAGITINAADTLLIFDEVQEVPRALSSLKYFDENAPEYAIIAAGSMLGVALHQGTSFPVGKVEFLDLYPMSFTEFLDAMDMSQYAELLVTDQPDFGMITTFKGKYIDALRQYYYIGGMPEAVYAFSQRHDFEEVRRIQMRLLDAYDQDFSKHAPNDTVPRIRMLWNSIPAQLARENRKFVYGHIRDGARAREYELAMQWLLDCGLIHKVNRITKPDMPLMAYVDQSAFKLYMLDVGLLAAKSNLDLKSLLEGNRVFEEFKGALTEQYVLQQLLSDCHMQPYYWTAERATAEVDFVCQLESDIIPMEVKAEENLKAKSLKQYVEKFSPEYAIRTSMSDYRKEEWLTNLPLYALRSINHCDFSTLESP